MRKTRKYAPLLAYRADSCGQQCPQHCPQHQAQVGANQGHPGRLRHLTLGEPLSLREVARMLGCSPWTVRQRLIPAGLPVFRSGASSKLIFFSDQVAAWILKLQGGR